MKVRQSMDIDIKLAIQKQNDIIKAANEEIKNIQNLCKHDDIIHDSNVYCCKVCFKIWSKI